MLIPIARVLLRVLPDTPAFRLTAFLTSLSRRQPLTERGRAALRTANVLHWGPKRRHVALAWGAGPLVLLFHGWGGRALQMAPLAQHLSALGFRVVAPDMTGHGDSPGRRISFRRFTADVARLVSELDEPVHALVGHSAAGLTMMAAREKYGVRADLYVCLNAPRAPYPPLASIRRLLTVRPGVLRHCRDHFFAQFELHPDLLERGAAYRYLDQGRLLLIYDRNDDEVTHTDADVIAEGWPGAVVFKTEGLGHNRVLWDDVVRVTIGNHLTCARWGETAHASPVAVMEHSS